MKLLLLIFALIILLYIVIKAIENYNLASSTEFGITFSDKYAKELGLDPDLVLDESLENLAVRNIRLPVYWDNIEKTQGSYDFSSTDRYLDKILQKRGKVILVVGYKQPRWPECHAPVWAENLEEKKRQEAILRMVRDVVIKYKDHPSIYAIQVENEPFMAFGFCPKLDREFLSKELDLVRSLTKKPIIISDSGEVRPWISPARLSDILGISLYRRVYDPKIGYIDYPLPPFYYQIKSIIVRGLFAPNNQKTIITELQAEPWADKPLSQLTPNEQSNAFPAKSLEDNINYSRKTGFDTSLLWGVEWWYYMKQKGHPKYWQIAKEAFASKLP